MLIGLFAASELVRPAALTRGDAVRAILVTAVCLAATMASPYGWGLLAYLFENWSVPRMMAIAELQPPPLLGYRAFYLYLGVCAAVLASQWRTLQLREFVTAAAFAALGLRFLRLTPLVLLVTAPMLAARLAPIASRSTGRHALLFSAICIGLIASRVPPRLLITELAAGSEAVAPGAFFSEDAIAFARRSGLAGPVFNSQNLGGYLAWTLYPDVQIFQDSRLQTYPPEHFLSILVASRSQPDWDVLVADVDWGVLSLPRPNQLSGVGRFPAADWAAVFRDGAIEIVVRRSGRYGGLAR
jgi:hypothetical protein